MFLLFSFALDGWLHISHTLCYTFKVNSFRWDAVRSLAFPHSPFHKWDETYFIFYFFQTGTRVHETQRSQCLYVRL